jgi:hypothetical protein
VSIAALIVLASFGYTVRAEEKAPAIADTTAVSDSLPVYHLGEIVTVRGEKDSCIIFNP